MVLDRLFEVFVTTKASGMGFGLALCRMIVERHKGERPLRQPSRAAPFFESRYPLEQPRGSLGFPRPTPRGMAVATFNTDTEALEPMAGALWTGYDASFPGSGR